MAKKKKKKIRWSGVAILAVFFSGVAVGLYFLLAYIGGIIKGWFTPSIAEESEVVAEQSYISPEMLTPDSLVVPRLERLVRQSTQLDTTILSISLYDLSAQAYVYELEASRPLIPASCMKIPTAIAAYELLGADHHYHTAVSVRGEVRDSVLYGDMHLQADDDPMLLTFDSLVCQLQHAGIRSVRGELTYSIERTDTLSSHPSTMSWDIPYARIPLLLRGEQYIKRQFRYALSQAGISCSRHDDEEDFGVGYVADDNDQDAWREVAVYDTPLTDVLSPMLIYSSNVKAEAVLYHLDRHCSLLTLPQADWTIKHSVQRFWEEHFMGSNFASFALRFRMQGATMLDGSGLSPLNRLSTHFLVEMLRYAWSQPSLRDYLIDEGLASPGHPTRRGSLSHRMDAPLYRDRIFVKTGTLTTQGVSSLSGYLHAPNGRWYIFSIINQNCPVAEGRLFQDAFCKAMMQ